MCHFEVSFLFGEECLEKRTTNKYHTSYTHPLVKKDEKALCRFVYNNAADA